MEKEIQRIKAQMKEMIQASAKIDALEDQKYPDGVDSGIAGELRKKEYRLKKLQEAMEGLGRDWTSICQITSWRHSMRRKRMRKDITRATSAMTR